MTNKRAHEENRISWNAATRQHNTHKGDQAKFLREGGSTLFDEEIDLLGDVNGKSLVHLQCNAGQDTLSIASQLGATVTGVDISDEAITFAQQLSADSAIPGTFIRSDLYDWFEQNETQYDVVFVSYGAVGWLSDINAWGRGIAKALKPGGHFVLVEFHPVFGMFEGDYDLTYDYMGGRHYAFDTGVGDYVGQSGEALLVDNAATPDDAPWENPNPAHEFAWGLAEIIMALVNAGLQIELLHEYPYSNGFKRFEDMRPLAGRRWTAPEDKPTIPMMFGIRAVKPA